MINHPPHGRILPEESSSEAFLANVPLFLENSLTRTKEEFEPYEPGIVRVYNCGPTVYQTQHIGNMRRYVVADLLRRVFIAKGYDVRSVTNITDVGHLMHDDRDEGEDKVVAAAAREKLDPHALATKYTNAFFNDLRSLNVLGVPEHDVEAETPVSGWPRATEHIEDMIAIVKALQEKGFAYETSRGVYFDVTKTKNYGALSGNTLEALAAGARVAVDTEKRHPYDFALWVKAPHEHIMRWPSPWGEGYPGWHIECSAMAISELGERIDIHTGGVDNKFPHHENEIAQSEGVLGHPFVKYWVHNEHVLLNGEKMSKSLGNVVTLAEVLDMEHSRIPAITTYEPDHVRMLFLSSHYRSKLDFSYRALDQARESLSRLREFFIAAEDTPTTGEDPRTRLPSGDREFSEMRMRFEKALCDDLNTPLAFSHLFSFIREYYTKKWFLSRNEVGHFREELKGVLGLRCLNGYFDDTRYLDGRSLLHTSLPQEEINDVCAQIDRAREANDYATADRLREEVRQRGYDVQTGANGTFAKPHV